MEPISQTQQVNMEGIVVASVGDIFISYASDAGEWVQKLTRLLLRPGRQVDSAPVDDYAGPDDERRARRYLGYGGVVVLITPLYAATREAEIDLGAFMDDYRPVLPIYGIHLQRAPFQELPWMRDVPVYGGTRPILESPEPEAELQTAVAWIDPAIDEVLSRSRSEAHASEVQQAVEPEVQQAVESEVRQTVEPEVQQAVEPGAEVQQAVEPEARQGIETPSDAPDLLGRLLTQYRAFISVTDVLRHAEEYAAAASPPVQLSTSLVLLTFAEHGSRTDAPTWAGDWIRASLGRAFDALRSKYLDEKGIPGESRPGGRAAGVRRGVALALQRAQDLARRTTGVSEIRARHLLAALLTDPRPESGAIKQLRRAQLDPDKLRVDLYDFARGYGDDDEAWGEILLGTVERDAQLSGFHADDSHSDDYLGVKKDVVSFAKLIAARTVNPPLSVGLFGEWGSGKTFFMRMLRGEVDRLARKADEAKRMQRDLPYWKRIVQIEFNAWHYVEGNLWASLVQHIFENLQSAGEARESASQSLRNHLLKQIGHEKQAERQAEREKNSARELLTTAQEEVDATRVEFERQAGEVARLSAGNVLSDVPLDEAGAAASQALRELGLTGVGASAAELRARLAEGRALLARGRAVAAPLLYAPDRGRRLAFLLLALFTGPVLSVASGWLLSYLGQSGIAGIGAASGGVAGLLSAGAVWLRSQLQRSDEWIRKIEQAQQELDEKIARAQAESLQSVREAEEKLRLAEADYQAAKRKEADAQRRVAEAEKRLEEASITELLTDFVETRANSNDYRKQLGTLALVRTDFERLSRYIEEQNWRLQPALPGEAKRDDRLEKFDTLAREQADRARRINRIVLYIDDLDRCPPAKVVEVLQAVHLLLAFPLFVVVVGVDARWVVRSVETRYRELLRTGDGNGAARDLDGNEFLALFGSASAHDYLEKIFQVPFWLRPMTDRASQAMVRGLLAPGLAPDAAVDAKQAAPLSAAPSPADAGTSSPVATRTTTAAAGAPAEPAAAPSTDAPAVGEDAGIAADSPAGPPIPAAPAPAPAAEHGSGAEAAHPEVHATTGHEPPHEDDLSPEALQIHPDEVKAIEAFAPLLGRSPRALKRFVNVYRLIKTSLTPYERRGWVARPAFLSGNAVPDYYAVLFLLAVDTGAPAAAPAVFRAIRELSAPLFFKVPEEMRLSQRALLSNQPPGTVPTLEHLVKRLDDDPELQGEPDWARVRQWLVRDDGTFSLPPDLGRLGRWVPRVSRYSFHTGRMARPQKQDAAPQAPPQQPQPQPAAPKRKIGTRRK